MLPDFEDAVFQVVKDWKNSQGFDLWPVDTLEMKRENIALCFRHNLITLLVDSQNRLEGFLILYRDNQYAGMRVSELARRLGGRYVVCDVLWIRPDLEKKDTLKRLFKKAFREHRDYVMGAEKLVMFRKWNGYNEVIYDFPKFYRKFGR